MPSMLSMSCSACGHTITAAEVGGLTAGVRRHVEAVCSAGHAEAASPAFLAAMRRLHIEAVAAP